MGTTARVLVAIEAGSVHAAELLDRGQQHVALLEDLWSRFVPTSEISRLNRARGRAVRVSPETQLLVRRAIEAWKRTAGRFDPTVYEALVAAGYDRTFDRIAVAAEASEQVQPAPGCAGITVDDDQETVTLPRGCGFDPGGIGKGLAADLVVDGLLAAGATGACVELGGDVRVRGCAPEASGWVVGIADPRRPGVPVTSVWLDDGGVASSSALQRSWTTAAGRAHHIIDPASGGPAATPIVGACVVAATATQAEIYATAACAGMPQSEIERAGVSGVTFDDQGAMTPFGEFEAFSA